MNTPNPSENSTQPDPIPEPNPTPKKSVIVNIRMPVDYVWSLKNQAVARNITVSDLIREKLLIAEHMSISLANPSSLEPKKKSFEVKPESAQSLKPSQSVENIEQIQENGKVSFPNGRCIHGFVVWQNMTSCPECKKK